MTLAINAYEPEDDGCPKCGSDDYEWVTCWVCHGECAFDLHDEDGVNYAEGEEYATCEECGGRGGHIHCHECQRRANSPLIDGRNVTK